MARNGQISKKASRRQSWLARLIQRDGRGCVWCGTGLSPTHPDATIEHVDPQSAGGINLEVNMVLACMPCNSARQSTPALDWLDACLARGLDANALVVRAAVTRAGISGR